MSTKYSYNLFNNQSLYLWVIINHAFLTDPWLIPYCVPSKILNCLFLNIVSYLLLVCKLIFECLVHMLLSISQELIVTTATSVLLYFMASYYRWQSTANLRQMNFRLLGGNVMLGNLFVRWPSSRVWAFYPPFSCSLRASPCDGNVANGAVIFDLLKMDP